jgi:hypothetical protein
MDIHFEQVGEVSESVEVRGTGIQLNTVDASLGNSYGTLAIVQLPFDSRNVVNLLQLQPGVSPEGADNGGKPDQGNVTLDGVDVNDQAGRTAFTSVLRNTLDSVQEFRVTTLNPTADQGRSSGAQVALVTKGGTDQLHGSAYWYNRNTDFAANNFFNNRNGVPLPKLNRNMFGASVGGPIKKGRLFYFVNFEGLIDASDGVGSYDVPVPSLRQGILKYRRTDGSIGELSPDQVKTMVDPNRIGDNAAILKIYNALPQPNNPLGGDGINTLGYSFKAALRTTQRTYISRFDYNVNAQGTHRLFWRGSLQNDRAPSLPQLPGQSPVTTNLDNSKGFAAGYTSNLRPNLVNTLRYGLTRQGIETAGYRAGGQAFGFGPYPSSSTYAVITPVHTIADDLSWVHGKHSFQFGGVGRIIRRKSTDYSWALDLAYSGTNYLIGQGKELSANIPDLDPTFQRLFDNTAAELLGILDYGITNYLYGPNGNPLPAGSPKIRNFADNEYEFYGQDTWQVTRGLTATIGLRWSLFPPIYETNGFQAQLTPSASTLLHQRQALALSGQPQYDASQMEFTTGGDLYPFHKKNFSPRVGLAYSPQSDSGWRKFLFGGPGKTVVRAGYGMVYDVYGQSLITLADKYNYGFSTQLTGAAGSFNAATAPRIQTWDVIPAGILQPAPPSHFPIIPQPQYGAYAAVAGVDNQLKPPYSHSVDFSIGRTLPRGFFVQGSYVGRFSHRSLIGVDVLEPLNLVDKKSGQGYFQAAQQMAALVNQNVPLSQVPAIPFWEDLWPGAAKNGLTASQGVYQAYQAAAPDWGATALFNLDDSCNPSCSIFGPGALVNPVFNAYPAITSAGWGRFNAMQWTVRKDFSNGLLLDFNYTYSKSMDLYSDPEGVDPLTGSNAGIINTSNFRQQYAVSDYNYPHQVTADWVYQLPFGKGRRFLSTNSKLLDSLFGGWESTGVYTARSGNPLSVVGGYTWPTSIWSSSYAVKTSSGPEPVRVGRNYVSIDGRSGPGLFADPLAVLQTYRYAYPGEAGNARNSLRGPTYSNFDLGLDKRFRMPYKESHTLQLRIEAFNALNTTHFNLPTYFGTAYGLLDLVYPQQFGKITSAGNARVLQFAARYEW